MTTSSEEALAAATAAVLAGSDELRRRFRGPLSVERKGQANFVTDADHASDRAIRDALLSFDPTTPILSEESAVGTFDAERAWLVDPLCGTHPFVNGLDQWGLSVALLTEGALEVGVVAIPTADELLQGIAGGGLWRNRQPFAPTAPELAIDDAALAVEIKAKDLSRLGWLLEVGRPYHFHSGVYPLAMLALGRLSAVVDTSLSSLVHVAGAALIAREAGAIVTDLRGEPIDWSRPSEPVDLLAAWPAAHGEIVERATSSLGRDRGRAK